MSSQEEFLEGCRLAWSQRMEDLLGAKPAARSEWCDVRSMLEVLAPFLEPNLGHLYLPTGGGQTMTAAQEGNEPGTIEFLMSSGKAAYIFKPRTLSVNYFAEDPAQSFIYIACDKLDPTGVYEHDLEGQEEVVETSPMTYHPRVVWDQGYIGIDQDGEEIPLPDEARLAMRFLGGDAMLVSNGSYWNGNARTYGGEHNRVGEDKVRELVSEMIRRAKASDSD